MLIKSALLSTMSGSLGGMTAARAKGGAYLRNRSIPVDPSTARQNEVRMALSSLSQAWSNTLTDTQREAWDLYAAETELTNRIGEGINISGQAMYVRCNTPRVQAGLAVVNDGPTTFGTPDVGQITLTSIFVGEEEITLGVAGTPDWAGSETSHLLVYLGRPMSPGRQFFGGPYRFARAAAGTTVPLTSVIIDTTTAPYVLTPGQKVALAVRVTDTEGRLSGRVKIGPGLVEDNP